MAISLDVFAGGDQISQKILLRNTKKSGAKMQIEGWGEVPEDQPPSKAHIIMQLRRAKKSADDRYINKSFTPVSEDAGKAIAHIGEAIRILEAME